MALKGKVIKGALVLMLIAVLPGLPPKTTFPFRTINVPPMRPLEGVLALNTLLNNAERLFEHELHGPEGIAVRGNATYVTVYGGKVLEIVGEKVRVVAKLGPECVGSFSERECGRPLGLAFDTKGNYLIVADPYLGIWQVHIKTGEQKLLVSKDVIVEEGGKVPRKPSIPNSVAVAKNGDIYWSDTASDFLFDDAVLALLSNPSGRLLHYSRATGKSRVLIDEVYGANGVTLSPDESVVLVGELGGQLIRRYYLKGPKVGTHDILVDGLPGSVDNLNGDEHGFWAALVIAVDSDHPSFTTMLAPFPNLRRCLVRIVYLLQAPFKILYEATGNRFALRVIHNVGNLAPMAPLFPSRGTVLRFDWEGNIKFALHNDDESSHYISQAMQQGDHLLLGSPLNPWLGRVKLTPEVLTMLRDPLAQSFTVDSTAGTTPPVGHRHVEEL